MRINWFDAEELVRGMDNLDDSVDIEDHLAEKYGLGLDEFCTIINKLLPLVIVGKSPLTGQIFRGFGKDGVFFLKEPISTIDRAQEGNKNPVDPKGKRG